MRSPKQMEALRARHRAWLSTLGLLDKPWLIIGSAPDPTLPPGLVAQSARIDINNAGRTAAALGLGRADLTFRTQRKSWAEWPDLDTRAMIWTHRGPKLLMLWEMHRKSNAKVGVLKRWPRGEREEIVEFVTGASLAGTGQWEKATTGIAAACYGLFVGVPQIVLAGISLDAGGHSYDTLHRERRQVGEDAFVLEHIRDRPELLSTEPALIERAGLKPWPPVSAELGSSD
jgi:hypothetical protein